MLCNYNHNQQSMEMNYFCSTFGYQPRNIQRENYCSNNTMLFQQFPYMYAFPPFFPPSEFLPFSLDSPTVNRFSHPHQPLFPRTQHRGSGGLGEKKISQNITSKPNIILQNETNRPQKPKKSIKSNRKVRYFDPTAAPILTSKQYNYVNNPEKDAKAPWRLDNPKFQYINEQSFPQEDQNPFIVFKHRKMKKKYKKFMDKCAVLQENQSSSQSSLSDNASQENNQDSSQKKSPQYNRGLIQIADEEKKKCLRTEMEIKVSVSLEDNEAKLKNYSNTDYRPAASASNEQ